MIYIGLLVIALIGAYYMSETKVKTRQIDGLTDALSGKQNTLVSGTNIKTINGNSILGSGNVEISASATTGVNSFNSRDGNVVLNGNDVTTALQTSANAGLVSVTTTPPNALTTSFQINRNASYSGGTVGWVNAGLFVDTTVGENATSFEWGIISRINNNALAGENVGGYFQGNKLNTGPTWGAVAEVADMRNASTTPTSGGTVGLEVDVWCNGSDNHNARFGIDVIVGNAQQIRNNTPGIGKGVATAGIRITPQNQNSALGEFKNGIIINSATQAGIVNDATGVWGILQNGTYEVGIDMSEAVNSLAAIRIKANDWISLEATDDVKFRYNSLTDAVQFTRGIRLPSATRTIGTAIDTYDNMVSWGGANAKAFTDTVTLNIDTMCGVGYFETLMSPMPTEAEVETVVRPIYCIVSSLIKELQDKKVI
jgi:hypothetical protein